MRFCLMIVVNYAVEKIIEFAGYHPTIKIVGFLARKFYNYVGLLL